MLGALAVLPVASPVLAIATAADLVFAAIERYKALVAEYTAAVDWRAPLEDDDPDCLEAEDERRGRAPRCSTKWTVFQLPAGNRRRDYGLAQIHRDA